MLRAAKRRRAHAKIEILIAVTVQLAQQPAESDVCKLRLMMVSIGRSSHGSLSDK